MNKSSVSCLNFYIWCRPANYNFGMFCNCVHFSGLRKVVEHVKVVAGLHQIPGNVTNSGLTLIIDKI